MMRSACLALSLCLLASPVWADDQLDALMMALRQQDTAAFQKQVGALEAENSVSAYVTLGDAYANYINKDGLEQPKNAKAAHYYRQAIDLANRIGKRSGEVQSAMHALARLLIEGKGTKRDAEEAVALLEEAIRQGHASSAYTYGKLLETGYKGHPSDAEAAAEQYRFALRDQRGEAALALARLLKQQSITAKSDDEVDGLITLGTALLQNRAEKGHGRSAEMLGDLYFEGLLVPKDDAQAMAWYSKGSDAGEPGAMLAMARMLGNGQGVPRDREEATRYARMAVASGSLKAAGELGERLLVGESYYLLLTDEEALEWLEKAAHAGHGSSIQDLSRYYTREGDTEQAVTYLRSAAESGSVSAMLSLYHAFAEGNGVEKDEVLALSYLEKAREASASSADDVYKMGKIYLERGAYGVAKTLLISAAEQGHVQAMLALGDHYSDGTFGAVDHDKAFIWYERAAEAEDIDGIIAVAKAYANEQGAPLDEELAREYFTKAEEQISETDYAGMSLIGSAYKNGYGLDKNLEKAFLWFEKSAAGGDPGGMLELARMVLWGAVEGYTAEDAVALMEQSAAKGNLNAMLEAGLLLTAGVVVPRDAERAFRYFERGATLGHAESMRHLGLAYLAGTGVEPDIEKGKELIAEAADRGNGKAMLNMAYLYYYPLEGQSQDIRQYIQWVERATHHAQPDADYAYARALLTGEGVVRNPSEARRYLQRAAAGGHYKASLMLQKGASHE